MKQSKNEKYESHKLIEDHLLVKAQVIKLCIKSPGNRKNIKGNYNRKGIGIADRAVRRLYFTWIFVHKKV